MWVCPIRTCRRRFATEEETNQHIDVDHAGARCDRPNVLLEQYRVFDTANLRQRREKAAEQAAKRAARMGRDEETEIADSREAYDSLTPRYFFGTKGLLDQDRGNECRTLGQLFDSRTEGALRLTARYTSRTSEGTFTKYYAWWVLFLHQKGPQVDKFIQNDVLDGAFINISHKCHFAWCLNVAHLEQVVKEVNDDRTRCKVGSRANDGGCNALYSSHPHDHCLLRNPIGEPFDEFDAGERPERRLSPVRQMVGLCANGCMTSTRWLKDPDDNTKVLCNACYKKKWRLSKKEAQSPNGTMSKKPRTVLQGPCVNGCTMTTQWLRDPDDKTKVLCNACYQKHHYLSKQEAQSPNGTRPKNQGPCVNGCTETPQWLKDPDDKTKVLYNACYHRKYRLKTKEGISPTSTLYRVSA